MAWLVLPDGDRGAFAPTQGLPMASSPVVFSDQLCPSTAACIPGADLPWHATPGFRLYQGACLRPFAHRVCAPVAPRAEWAWTMSSTSRCVAMSPRPPPPMVQHVPPCHRSRSTGQFDGRARFPPPLPATSILDLTSPLPSRPVPWTALRRREVPRLNTDPRPPLSRPRARLPHLAQPP